MMVAYVAVQSSNALDNGAHSVFQLRGPEYPLQLPDNAACGQSNRKGCARLQSHKAQQAM